jgi:hypothetical protein
MKHYLWNLYYTFKLQFLLLVGNRKAAYNTVIEEQEKYGPRGFYCCVLLMGKGPMFNWDKWSREFSRTYKPRGFDSFALSVFGKQFRIDCLEALRDLDYLKIERLRKEIDDYYNSH